MTSKLRLVFVNEYFSPVVLGGAEVSTLEQARALVAAGHEVTVLTPRYRGAREETIDGVRVVRFPFPVKLKMTLALKPLWFQNPLAYVYLGYRTWLYARGADIVHAHNSFSVVGAFLGARLAGCRFIVTIRDYMHLCSGGAICLHDEDLPPHRCSMAQYRACFRIFQTKYTPHAGAWMRLKASVRHIVETLDVKVRQWALAHADRVVTVSDAVGAIHRAAGVVTQQSKTVYNVPPTEIVQAGNVRERWGVPNEAPLVLYVGKQSFGKGTDMLLEAALFVHASEPATRFLLAGRSDAFVAPTDDERVVSTGVLPHEEVLPLYAAADIVVLPAVWKEPFPRSLLEAMAAGKPVVATRSGGIPELVVHGETGLMVPAKDSEAFAAAVLCLIRDRDLAGRMGQEGRRRLQQVFARRRSVESLLTAYDL